MPTIWHALDDNAADWFVAGVEPLGLNWERRIIPNAGTAAFLNLPESIKNILRLDKPDLIATVEHDSAHKAAVSIEITTTTPQSQHAKQRVPRLVAAAEENVPSIYIIPGRKLSGGSAYQLGADLYMCTTRMHEINEVPVFVYRYPSDDAGHLQDDPNFPSQPLLASNEINRCFAAIQRIIRLKIARPVSSSAFKSALAHDPVLRAEHHVQQAEAAHANVEVGNYDTLTEIHTQGLPDFLEAATGMSHHHIVSTAAQFPDRIRGRKRSIVFRPGGRILEHAGDPYCGMLAFFDYAFCRTGPTVEDRNCNLIFMPMKQHANNITDEYVPNAYHYFWENRCPFRFDSVPSVQNQFNVSHHMQYGCVYTKTKPLRIHGYFSDIIVFQDSMLVF